MPEPGFLPISSRRANNTASLCGLRRAPLKTCPALVSTFLQTANDPSHACGEDAKESALDKKDASLEAALGPGVGEKGLEKTYSTRDRRVLPRLQEAGLVAADAVEQRDLFQRLDEGLDTRRAEVAAAVREWMAGVMAVAAGLRARDRPAPVDVRLPLAPPGQEAEDEEDIRPQGADDR